MPGSTSGRFPTQTQVLEKVLPAFAYLVLSSSQPDIDLTTAFKSLWKPNEEPVKSFISRVMSDITFKNTIGEVEKMVELAEKQLKLIQQFHSDKILPCRPFYVQK